jgi:RimJ/RimL family protein N-acetyltransferase
VLRGERIMLSPLRDEDSELLFRWINDRELVLLNAPFSPVAEADHRRWFDAMRTRDDAVIFGIRTIGDDELIGSCQLHGIDRRHRRAELQIRIGERAAWGHGYGTEAVQLLVAYGFEKLGLHRVELHVFATNEPALRTYERAGFRREGVKRDGAFLEDAFVDVVAMAILAVEEPHNPSASR